MDDKERGDFEARMLSKGGPARVDSPISKLVLHTIEHPALIALADLTRELAQAMADEAGELPAPTVERALVSNAVVGSRRCTMPAPPDEVHIWLASEAVVAAPSILLDSPPTSHCCAIGLAEFGRIDLAVRPMPRLVFEHAMADPLYLLSSIAGWLRIPAGSDALQLAVRKYQSFREACQHFTHPMRFCRSSALAQFEQPAPIEINKEYPVFKSGAGARFLSVGWHQGERWGRWTNGHVAIIKMRLPADDELMRYCLVCHCVPVPNGTNIFVFVNGVRRAFDLVAGDGGNYLRIPLTSYESLDCASGTRNVAICVGNPRSPFDLGINDDRRKLGIGLRTLRICPISEQHSTALGRAPTSVPQGIKGLRIHLPTEQPISRSVEEILELLPNGRPKTLLITGKNATSLGLQFASVLQRRALACLVMCGPSDLHILDAQGYGGAADLGASGFGSASSEQDFADLVPAREGNLISFSNPLVETLKRISESSLSLDLVCFCECSNTILPFPEISAVLMKCMSVRGQLAGVERSADDLANVLQRLGEVPAANELEFSVSARHWVATTITRLMAARSLQEVQ
jgi:hypothetical protein